MEESGPVLDMKAGCRHVAVPLPYCKAEVGFSKLISPKVQLVLDDR